MNLEAVYLGNSLTAWLEALGALIVSWVVLRLARSWISRKLTVWSAKTATTIDDLIADLAGQTKLITLLAISVFAASTFLSLPARVGDAIGKGTICVVLLQAGIWAVAVVQYLIKQYVRLESQESELEASVAALGFLGKLAVWSLVLILALENLNFDITALVTSLGIGGIAIALAVQNILGDLFASLSILLDKPFVAGDFIIVDNYVGTVEHIGLKTTRVRSLTGEQVVFSNSDLLKSRLRNFKRMQERRVVLQLGVVYQTPADLLEEIPTIVREAVESQQGLRFDRTHFKEFGPYSLNFEIVYFVSQPDYLLYMDTLQAINLRLFRRFEEKGIEFAYPTQSLFVTREGAVESSSKGVTTGSRPGSAPQDNG